MPALRLTLAPLLNPGRYGPLAAALTRITADTLGKRPEVTTVFIDDKPFAQCFVGGRTVQAPVALLEISVTAGTNTPAEKAAFADAAWRELRAQLAPHGELAEASYVIVRDVAAADWGYGGVTQLDRRLARERVAAESAV